ncbi:MAG: MBL fold metallo-hydrolase [Gammaproteobacteria bacterium]|jgi:glyoxylase-like metal-dependent hydrolase (beta-lactamase superfamily II)
MPKSRSQALTLLAITLLAPLGVLADNDAVPIKTVAVASGIHMLIGRGGNVAVSSGADGVLVVDAQYATQYDAIVTAIRDISDVPTRFLINTHWHDEHSGSNASMSDAGAIIVAHDNVRTRLSTDQVIEFFRSERPASPARALPVITFTSDITFHFNDDTVRVFHVRNAHTDGDAAVVFRRANVIHTGDVFFSEMYPFIDTGSGGSLTGVIAAVEKFLVLADDDTKIIPGHGPLSDKRGLTQYHAMLQAVQRTIAQLIVSGATEEQVILAHPTASFDAAWGGGFLGPDRFVRMVYDNIKRETLR